MYTFYLPLMSFFSDLFGALGTTFKAFFGDPERKRVLSTGISAPAKILNLSESGAGYITVNEQPYVVIDLEVYPKDEKPFKATVKTIISRLATPQFQPGSMVYVKYDPNDKTKVYFDTTETKKEPTNIGNTKEKFTPGKAGFAEILGIKKAKGKKAGNQLYSLTVEITGEGLQKYTNTKNVPLPDYSLQYFQVGKKYPCVIDKNDKTKVDMKIV